MVKKSFLSFFSNLMHRLATGYRRFPAPLALAIAAAAVSVWWNHNQGRFSGSMQNNIQRTLMMLFLGLLLTLAVDLLRERLSQAAHAETGDSDTSPATASVAVQTESTEPTQPTASTSTHRSPSILLYIAAYAAAIGIPILYRLYLLPDFTMRTESRYFILLIASGLLATTMHHGFSRKGYPMHVVRLLLNAFITALFSLVLMLSLFAILFSLDKLFGVNIQGVTYRDTAILVWCIFGIAHFLSAHPLMDKPPEAAAYPKTLRVLFLYILMPLLAVYTAILYGYSIKILVTWTWPHGMVSNLVLWYALIAILVQFLISPVADETRWGKLFLTWFPRICAPTLAMLFAAIGIRMAAYGITEPRWFALILGIWALLALFGDVRRHPRIPLLFSYSLMLTGVLVVFSPMDAYTVSRWSQNQRFEAILTRNGMLLDGKITPSVKMPSDQDKMELGNIINYFQNAQKPDLPRVLPVGYTPAQAQQVFGFVPESGMPANVPSAFAFYSSGQIMPFIPIDGYDALLQLRVGPITATGPRGLTASYASDTRLFTVSVDGKEIYRKNLHDYLVELAKRRGTSPTMDNSSLPIDDMRFEDDNDRISVRYQFLVLSGNPTQGMERDGGDVEGFVLIHLK